jgi:hypothetical protein
MLVFKAGGSGREYSPSKTSRHSFSTVENHDGGPSLGEEGEQQSSKTSSMSSFSRVEVLVVVMVLVFVVFVRSNHQKRAGVARFQGRWWWRCSQGATAVDNKRVCLLSKAVMVLVVAQSYCPRKRARLLVFKASVVVQAVAASTALEMVAVAAVVVVAVVAKSHRPRK